MEYFLEMTDICKQFPGCLANDCVNLQIKKGEVHALLGENGAGKSTLMNILYGLYTPTSGEIKVKGKKVVFASPKDAIELGIGMVHQHFMLIPNHTVVENIVLGMEGEFDLKKSAEKILALSNQYGMDIDPFAKVWQLSVGQQQRVEIIKALYRGAHLLILDEPTAVLTPQEAKELFRMIKQLTGEGHTVIFISHKLNEVMAVSDRITVLRQGKTVGTVKTSEASSEQLARMMVGRDVIFKVNKKSAQPGKTVLEVKDVEALSNKNILALKKISLEVKAGEILGIAGVDGNGQSELVEAITGLRKIISGKVFVNGKDITNAHPREVLENKVSHIPEDRHLRGLVMTMTLKENVILQSYNKPPFSKYRFLNWKVIRDTARHLIKEYDVRTPSEDALACNLSGGNQQKLILAREIFREPQLLIAMHPTRGLDVGAIEYVHKRIIEQRDRGTAVLLISTEIEEIFNLSDRIAVIYEGQIMGLVKPDEVTVEQVGLMMAGTRQEEIDAKIGA